MAILTGYWGLDGIIFMVGFVVLAYMYMTRKFLYWKKRGVEEAVPTPFIGNLSDCVLMKKPPGVYFKDLYDQMPNAPYIGLYIFDRPALLICDPDLVKNVLVKDFTYFADRFVSASTDDPLGNRNLFLIKNPAWKILRSKLTPIFTSGKLKKMFLLMLEVGKDLKTHLHSLNLSGEGQDMELKELCAKYTTDLIATTAYGLQVNSLNNPDAEFRKRGREVFNFNFRRTMEFTAMFFAPQLLKPLRVKFFTKEATSFLRHALWDTLVERERSGQKRNDLIDLLIELKHNMVGTEESKIFEFDGDNLVAQAAVFFTGGFETSSTTLSFTLYEIALAPKIQTKLRQEITDALANTGGEFTYDMIMNLPYMDMVVSETLRKYPTLPFLDRLTLADYKVPNTNLVIEKGTPIYIPMLAFHMDPKYFPNPEVFDPERFSEEKKKERPNGVYFPFGDGPHICIGMRLGLLQTKLGLAHIISEYEVAPCKQTTIPMIQDPRSILASSKYGIHLNIRQLKTVSA